MLLELPPNYQYGGLGTTKPAFHGTTKEAVLRNMAGFGRMQRHPQYPKGVEYYRCIYCEHDESVQRLGASNCYHPPHLLQIDHIVPFSKIAADPNTFYKMDSYSVAAKRGLVANFGYNPDGANSRTPGNDPMETGAPSSSEFFSMWDLSVWDKENQLHMAILYNDVNNLHAVCAGHNQDKGGRENYLNLKPQQIFEIYRPR